MFIGLSSLQVREVLAVCLSQPLVETEEFQEAVKGIRNMAREELLTVLQNVHDILKGKRERKKKDIPPNIPSLELGDFILQFCGLLLFRFVE